ncbi:MAG: winged helix-turn-helix transcriptional regulator [Chloroflexi bacterium]|jgi:DeoR family suf operon transcriptional repressor|nr:winged helix-turn-helix transcriptional regulator [Anaerolineaceae bacterium]NMB90602.1 winged helix-turn-helix transcriptional regulator [Chloroflexota bacterium]
MKSTRERILQTLLNHPNSSINELADSVGINAISVRHHLTSLQADGLVTAEEERHGVGRPRLVYFLTEKGLDRFPSRYFRLTNRLLDELKGTLPEETINLLFQKMAANLASTHAKKMESLSMEEKLDFIKELLAQEGFSVQWQRNGSSYEIHEISCPYYHVGQSHPEVCEVDQTLISTLLSIPAEKVNCVLHGDHHCTYVIQPAIPAVEKDAS